MAFEKSFDFSGDRVIVRPVKVRPTENLVGTEFSTSSGEDGSGFPRLLIIAQEVPQTINAGGILLERLLRDYCARNIMVIGPRPNPSAHVLSCRYLQYAPMWERLRFTRLARVTDTLLALGFGKGNLDARLMAEADRFRPQVLLTVFQGFSYYSAAFRYAEARRIPIAMTCYDDPQGFSRAPQSLRRFEIARDRRVYKAAATRFTISTEMNELFTRRYGVPGRVLYPNRCETITSRDIRKSGTLRSAGRLVLGYAGTLGYGYGSQLEAMLPVFEETGALLRVYSSSSPMWPPSRAWSYAGFDTPERTWEKVKSDCDVVILPYCWPENGHEILYTTHFPSKLPEYLALGVPVMIVGPKYATGVRWAMKHPDAALVVGENCSAAFRGALARLRNDAELRMSLAARGLKAGQLDFDPAAIKRQFIQAIRETSKSNHH